MIIEGTFGVLTDNDLRFVDFISAAIKYSDPEATIKSHKCIEGLSTVITPSQEDFKQSLIINILGVHRMLHLKPIFSKSLKISKSVQFITEFQ